jgi:hypothetical protein
MKSLTDQSTIDLENTVANYRRLKATDRPIFAEMLAELNRRRHSFDFDKSMALILVAARERRFVSCKDLADASAVDWNHGGHYGIGKHLWDLNEYSHLKHGLLLGSIVVVKRYLKTGGMEPFSLAGFVKAAKLLGYTVITDDETFLRGQQERVFTWAKEYS